MKRRTYIFFLLSLSVAAWARLPDTLNVCRGDNALLDIRSAADERSSVYWTTPAGIITNAEQLKVKQEGRYRVTFFSQKMGKVVADSTFVRFIAKPGKVLRDTVFCKGQVLRLSTGLVGLKHRWNTGESGSTLEVRKEGLYKVTIDNGVCVFNDSAKVVLKTIQKELLPAESFFCLNEKQRVLSVKVKNGTKLTWSTGVSTNTTSVSREGWYWVKSEEGSCGIVVDSTLVSYKACECEMMIPNSFTPNEDGRNDLFYPITECEYSYFSLLITDRWGNTVYSAYQPGARWDGRFKGNLCPEDVYVYKIESQAKGNDKKNVRTGYISLIR